MLFIVQRLAGVSQCPDFNDISFDDLERFVYSKEAVVRDIALSKVILFWLKCHPGFIGTSRLAEVFFSSFHFELLTPDEVTVALAVKYVVPNELLFASLHRVAQSLHAVYVHAEWYGKVDMSSETHVFSESPRHCVAFRYWLFKAFVLVQHG